MVSEIEKGEATVDAVEGDPAAEADTFSDVVDEEFAAESVGLDPIEGFLARNVRFRGLN